MIGEANLPSWVDGYVDGWLVSCWVDGWLGRYVAAAKLPSWVDG